MAVNDHGLEVLRRSGEQVTPGSAADLYIKTKVINGNSDPVKVAVVSGGGSGTSTIHEQVLAADDLIENYTWAAFGTKNERVTQIDFTSVSVLPGQTLRKSFTYTFSSGAYRLDSVAWVIV